MTLNIFRGSALREVANLVTRPPVRPGVPMTNRARRVVLITGVSSNIGRGTAELPAARGDRVFSGGRAAPTTRALAGVEVAPLDVLDEASATAEVRGRAGRIDVLTNYAGVNLVGVVEEASISQARALFETYRMRLPIQPACTGYCRPGCSSQACASPSHLIHRVRALASRNRALNPERAACSISSAWSSRQP